MGVHNKIFHTEASKERRHKTDIRTVQRIVEAFSPYKMQVTLVLIAIFFTTVLGAVNPFLIKYIFDDAIGKRNLHLLLILVSLMIIMPMVEGIIGVGQTYLNSIIGQKVMRDFRNRLYRHLQSMSLHFFTLEHTGEIQSRLSNDVGGVQNVVTNTATSIVSNLSTALSTIIAMVFISPLLTIISLGLLPLYLWITYKVGNVRRTTSTQTQKSLASLTTMMQETLSISGILLVKTFGRQKYAQEQFEKETQRLTDMEVRQQMVGRWFLMFIGTFFSMTPAIVYLIAGLQIINHTDNADLSLGSVVAFITLQNRLFFPLGQLLSIQIEIQGALALFDRLFEYLDLPIDIEDKANPLYLTPHEVQGKVTFAHVSFTYKHEETCRPAELRDPEHTSCYIDKARDHIGIEQCKTLPQEELAARTVINNVSFEVQPGQLAALVGPSGAGKTTLAYLVPRLYDVESGVIKIDGHNVKDIALSSLNELIGVVTQESYLFHASIRENLLYARPDASEEEMIAAAKVAAIHDHIMELDDAYDTIVGERGYKLSGGEKQRISIARAILKNPRILILDEATSALDTHSERVIQAALEPLMRGRTTLAIAHRLSTILSADVILVVDEGEIVEYGAHQELLAHNGLYARLYNEQFSPHVEA